MILLLFFTMLGSGSQASDDHYQYQVQPVVRALEGLCVFLPCTFKYPQNSRKSKYGYWYRLSRNQDEELVASNAYWVSPSTKGRFQLVGKPEDGNCSLIITDVQNSDQGLYYFRLERVKYVKNSFTKSTFSLEVTDRTQPDIYMLEPLWPNRWGTVICMFNATFDWCSAPSFSWTGQVLSTDRFQVSTHRSSVLKIAPRPQDQGTNLTCTVRFSPWGVIFQKTVRLDVACLPQFLGLHCTWETPALQCSCLALGLPVPALHWWLGSELLSENCSKASVQFSTQGLWDSTLRFLKKFDTDLTLSCEVWNLHRAQNGSVLLLPDEKGTLRGAFSNGVLVGTGIAGFLSLCVILILVIFLRRKGRQTKQMSRRSTILDYINIFPRSGSQAPNQEVEPHGPSQPSPPARLPKPRKNPKQMQKSQKEHCTGSHAEATPPLQASQDQESEVQYSQLYFPGRRSQVFQATKNSQEEYVEMRFC